MKIRLSILLAMFLIVPITFLAHAEPQEAAPRKLVVAAAQTPNLDNQYNVAKDHAEKLIVEAASKGAKLILIPEFALVGYKFEDRVWEMAEPLKGPTVKWLRGLCRKYNVYIATSILEVRDDDFYNTMVLVGPGDNELWAHSKIEPALYEANYFRGAGINLSVFDTPIGRIGMSICMDNTKSHTARDLLQGKPEILLMAYSAPETPIVPKKMRQEVIDQYIITSRIMAQILGVPVVQCNKTGRWDTPLPGFPGLRGRSDFVARSRILDAQGNVLASLEKQEAVIVAEVELISNPATRPDLIPERRWLFQKKGLGTWFSDYVYHRGERRYERSKKRIAAVEKAKKRFHE